MMPHEQRIEEYNDAYFALLMDAVVEKEAAMLDRPLDESQEVSAALDRRCLKTIARYFSKRQRPKRVKRVLGDPCCVGGRADDILELRLGVCRKYSY